MMTTLRRMICQLFEIGKYSQVFNSKIKPLYLLQKNLSVITQNNKAQSLLNPRARMQEFGLSLL